MKKAFNPPWKMDLKECEGHLKDLWDSKEYSLKLLKRENIKDLRKLSKVRRKNLTQLRIGIQYTLSFLDNRKEEIEKKSSRTKRNVLIYNIDQTFNVFKL